MCPQWDTAPGRVVGLAVVLVWRECTRDIPAPSSVVVQVLALLTVAMRPPIRLAKSSHASLSQLTTSHDLVIYQREAIKRLFAGAAAAAATATAAAAAAAAAATATAALPPIPAVLPMTAPWQRRPTATANGAGSPLGSLDPECKRRQMKRSGTPAARQFGQSS